MPRTKHSGSFGQPGETYTFDNPQQDRARIGAASLNEDYQQALAMEQHRASQEYERLHYELSLSKMRQEQTEDRSKVEQQMKYAAMMEEAVPKLYSIDPADKNAHKQAAEIMKAYPHLGGYQPFLQHVDHIEGAIKGARELDKRADDMAGRQTDREAFQTQLATQRSADISDRQKDRQQHQDDLAKLRAEMKANAGPSAGIQTAYQKSVNESKIAQDNLDKIQGYLDIHAANERKFGTLDDSISEDRARLLKSQNQWQIKLAGHDATKNALESVHPQLNPAFKPDAGETTGAPVTQDAPPPADAPPQEPPAPAAQSTPVNPVIDTPAIPQPHIDYLVAHPETADHFNLKYGKDASTQYLSE